MARGHGRRSVWPDDHGPDRDDAGAAPRASRPEEGAGPAESDDHAPPAPASAPEEGGVTWTTHGPSADADADAPEAAEMLRITVYATIDQVDHLDRDRIRIRRASRRVLERTAIIRGLLEGYRRSGLDLAAAGVSTEEDLADLVATRLAKEDA